MKSIAMEHIDEKTIPLVITVLIISLCFFWVFNKPANEVSLPSVAKPTERIKDELIITLLDSSISNAIKNYYGELKQYDIFNAKIDSLEKASNGEIVFKVQVSVITFEGPHNPPYGLETMTFTVSPISVTLDKYIHKDE